MRAFSHGLLLLAGALLEVAGVAEALSAAEWRKQSVYQVVTDRFARTDLSTTARCDPSEQVYCGGTWRGLISKLDYIQGMGFTAVWISPIVKQIDGNSQDGSSYHGYWAQDIWALNSAFGTEADLKELSAALHARGMYLMLDIVTNHMAYMGCRTCVDYSKLNPFSSQSYYHSPCEIDYNNQKSVEECWQGSNVVSLVDLRTEDESVRSVWNDWISKIVSTYSIDGLRVDSAKHVETSFWSGFQAAAGGIYMVGEVFQGDPAYVTPYQQYFDGLTDYACYYYILRAFQSTSGSIGELVAGLDKFRGMATDPSLYGSFLENHDVERFPSFTQDKALAKNAIAITMLKDGIPLVYQGQEQHYAGQGTPHNREALWSSGYSTSSEFYKWITALNQIRSQAIAQSADYLSYKSHPIYSDSHTIAMRKGTPGYQVVGVFTNAGSSSSPAVTLASSTTGFEANQPLVDVMSCTAYTTDGSGGITVTLDNGLPRVLYPTARLAGSAICPDLTGGTTTGTTPGTTTSPVRSTTTGGDDDTSACGVPSTTPITTPTTLSTVTSTTTSITTTDIDTVTSACIATSTTNLTTSTSDPVVGPTSANSTCSLAAADITFNQQVATSWGETVKIVGNIAALGNWDPRQAVALDASKYTQSNPLWSATVRLAPGTSIQYKFIKVSSSGAVSWEADPNRTYTVPCETATVSETWRRR